VGPRPNSPWRAAPHNGRPHPVAILDPLVLLYFRESADRTVRPGLGVDAPGARACRNRRARPALPTSLVSAAAEV